MLFRSFERLDRFARQIEPLELDALNLDAAAFLLEASDARRRKAAGDDAGARDLVY